MRERRGALGRVSELAGSAVAGVRRRQQARAPKVLLYDDAGRPRTLPPEEPLATSLLDTADAMIELTGPAPADEDAAPE
jgi:hypothetical protein